VTYRLDIIAFPVENLDVFLSDAETLILMTPSFSGCFIFIGICLFSVTQKIARLTV
jgi:hypothetical protein